MDDLARRWRRDAVTLLWITLPFALLAGGLLVAGRFASGGWAALDHLVYAMTVAALWAATAAGWLAWIVLRDGWQVSSAPAIAVLALLAALAAGWGWRHFAEEADCRSAHDFYASLAEMPARDRPAAIRAGGRLVTDPPGCAVDELVLSFGGNLLIPDAEPVLPDGERLAVLDELLRAGLPPVDRLLYGYAVDDGDADASRLLLRRREALNVEAGAGWELFPDHIVQPLITRAEEAGDVSPDPVAARYRATLAVYVEEGLADSSAISPWTLRKLTELGLLP